MFSFQKTVVKPVSSIALGWKTACLRKWRALRRSTVSAMSGGGVPVRSKSTITNCDAPAKTITLVVSSLASAYSPEYGTVMIGTILATLPTLLVFFAMQRQFVQGMLGSVK